MSNREKVREWVLQKYKLARIKGFKPMAIVKDLNIPIEQVYQYCGEMVTEDNILYLKYWFPCECGFSNTYESLASIPERCEWCDEEINSLNDTYIEFGFIR